MSAKRGSTKIGRYVLRSLVERGGRYDAPIRDTESGRVWTHRLAATIKAAAWQEAVAYVHELSGAVPDHGATCGDLWPDYLASRALRPVSMQSYAQEWKTQLAPVWAERQIAKVAPIEVERWVATMRDAGQSPATYGRRLGLLGGLCRFALRLGYIQRDPTAGIRRGGSRKDIGRPLSVEECRTLLEYLSRRADRRYHQRQLYVATALALYTGLRSRNVRELRWTCVNLTARRIEIAAAEMKGARDHVVPIHEDLVPLLREELRYATAVDGYVLGSGKRAGCPHRGFDQGFHAALRACALPCVRWHDLRHTFATLLSTRVPWAVLQALLGHAPSSVTAVYTRPSWDALVAGIATLPNLLPRFLAAEGDGKISEFSA